MGQGRIEIFKEIQGFPMYRVSNFGNIRNKHGRLLRPQLNHNKYPRIGLYIDKNTFRHLFVHRLVAEHFIPNPNNLPQVNHMDGIKTNNAVENLEWVTLSENMIHAYENGLSDQGETHYRSALTNDQAKQIYDLAWSGHRPKDIAQKFGILATSVCNIKYKRSWKHIHK